MTVLSIYTTTMVFSLPEQTKYDLRNNKMGDSVFMFFNLLITCPEFALEPNIPKLYLLISFLNGFSMLFLDFFNSCIKTTW